MNKIQYSNMMLRNFFVKLGDLAYYKTLENELDGVGRVLDVGCGSWSPLANVRKKKVQS